MGNCLVKFAKDEWTPVISLLSLQFGFSLLSFATKFTINEGFNPFILTAYRQLAGFILVSVLAFLYERKTVQGMNLRVFIQHVMFSLLGGTLNIALFSQGLKFTTPTIASGINNLSPVLPLIAAVLFRTEKVQFKSVSGCLKLGGTALSIGGSMLASFFHGFQVLPDSAIDWRFLGPPSTTQQPRAIGPIMIALSCVAKFGYLVLQRRWFEDFPFPYTSNSIMSVLSSLQCAIVGLLMKRTLGSWSLVSPLRIVSVIYSGAFGSVIALLVTNLFIAKKGLLFVSVFNPVTLIFIQMLGWAFFQDNIYLGSLLGSGLLLVGLVLVLLANWKEDRLKSLDAAATEDARLGSGLFIVGYISVLWTNLKNRLRCSNNAVSQSDIELGDVN